MRMMKVLVVDDSRIVCQGLKATLEQDNDIKVVGFALNGIEAVNECASNMPDVVLMDIKMPVIDGISGVKLIRNRFGSEIKILMLTTFADRSFLDEALKNGANGYVLKNADTAELISAVKAVSCGLIIIDKEFAKNRDRPGNVNYIDATSISEKKTELTCMEYSILRKLVEGKSSKEIAFDLGISYGSLRNKVSQMLSKYNMKDRTELAIFALENDFV
jgi:DNA-binding NarL/FixJ family response regulator